MKPLNLPKESKEALLNGASMFLIPCEATLKQLFNCLIDFIFSTLGEDYDIKKISPYQIGDEVYFETAKEFICDYCKGKNSNCTDCYGTGRVFDVDKQYKATIKDVKVVRLHDLNTQDVVSIMSNPNMFLEDWYNKQYGNYEENPYVFLYEVEETK